MNKIFLIATLLCATSCLGQTLGKGIYLGNKSPFTICYLSYTNSTIEVEYFYQKGGQIFGHKPAKKLEVVMESFSSKPEFKSKDDSIMVFNKSDHYLIKNKGTVNVKVYKSSDDINQTSITTLRNRYRLFLFSQKLFDECKVKLNYDDKKFHDFLNSYELEKYIAIDNDKFIEKLNETSADFYSKWK